MTTELALSYDLEAIEHANLAPTTKAQYRKAIVNYLATGQKLGDAHALAEHARGLKTSSRSFLKAAIRLVSAGVAHAMKASATPENIGEVQAALLRIEALDQAVQVQTVKGTKAHTWLTQAQVKQLMATCGDDLEGRRDWIVLALLVGAGLRREELVSLSTASLKEQGARFVLEVKGKGAKDRVIPVKPILAERIREWRELVGDGLLARSLGRKREIGSSLSAIGIFNVVRKHGAMIGKPDLDPHDLRRTYAQLGFDAGVPITQISKLLGHSSVATTQRYLNLDLDLETTISDFIPLE